MLSRCGNYVSLREAAIQEIYFPEIKRRLLNTVEYLTWFLIFKIFNTL